MDIGKVAVNNQLPLSDSKPHRPDDMKRATKEFEAFFLTQMLKVMRESVPKDGLLSGGRGGEIYTSMLDDALSKEMASRGGIGIGQLMLNQLEAKK